MVILLKRNGEKSIKISDEPQFFESFNFRNVIAIYPQISDDKLDVTYSIYAAEGGHIYSSQLTKDQIKGAINGELALMGNLQRQAFYILTQDSGYGTRISDKDFRVNYCARLSLVTPPRVYINCEDFDGEIPPVE